LAEGREALAIARELRDSATADAAAQGAIQQAIFQVRRGAWKTDGNTRVVKIGRAIVSVTARDERGRINPNQTGAPLLAALLINTGVHPAEAADLAAALVDWRTTTTRSIAGGPKLDRYRRADLPYGPPGRPFTSIDELAQVPGMTAPLLERVREYLSVYQPGPPAALANDMSLTLRSAAVSGGSQSLDDPGAGDRIIKLLAIATLTGGTKASREAEVHLGTALGVSRDWRILTWERPH
jgi:general secretion pathway protein K